MRRALESVVSAWRLAVALAIAAISNVTQHWMLATFSLVGAFGVWMVIQDVENPRTDGVAPIDADSRVAVEPLNVPDGYIVLDLQSVKVLVNARKDDLPGLRPGDFKATIDVQGVEPGTPASRPVKVEARRSGVEVRGVQPSSIEVNVVQAATKELPVKVNVVGAPPDGYETEDESVEPAFVTVRGRQELVALVATVDLDVNLSGARDDTTELEGDLVARTATGNPVAVTLSRSRAKVTYHISQTFAQRSFALVPALTGAPAAGYVVASVSVDPPTVVVTGVKAFVDSLKQLGLEKLDITGARSNITQSRQIERPPNVSLERQSVTVRVEIRPIDCGASVPGGPCGSATLLVAPTFTDRPTGLVPDSAAYIVTVRVSGPVAQLSTLKPTDLKATVSLAGGLAGTFSYSVTIAAPTGVKVEGYDPLAVTLVPVAIP